MSLRDDEQFKNYLKEFQPVAPKPLPIKTRLSASRRVFLLAASAAACVTIALVWVPRHRKQILPNSSSNRTANASQVAIIQGRRGNINAKQAPISTPLLTKLAFDDRDAFDTFLSDRLQTQFPRMESDDSTLRVLAKE